MVFDQDMNGEELILSTRTSAKQIVDAGKNATVICEPKEEEYKLCFAVAWFPDFL